MPKRHRLARADFSSLRGKHPRRIVGALFTLTISAHKHSLPKIACVVSKKVSLRAHERNVIKRRCREIMRALLKNARPPVALIIHAKREAAGAPFADLKRDLERLLGRGIHDSQDAIQSPQ